MHTILVHTYPPRLHLVSFLFAILFGEMQLHCIRCDVHLDRSIVRVTCSGSNAPFETWLHAFVLSVRLQMSPITWTRSCPSCRIWRYNPSMIRHCVAKRLLIFIWGWRRIVSLVPDTVQYLLKFRDCHHLPGRLAIALTSGISENPSKWGCRVRLLWCSQFCSS